MTDFGLEGVEKATAVHIHNSYGVGEFYMDEQWTRLNPYDLKQTIQEKVLIATTDYPKEKVYVARAIYEKLVKVLGDVKPETSKVQTKPPKPSVQENKLLLEDMEIVRKNIDGFRAMSGMNEDKSLYVVWSGDPERPMTLNAIIKRTLTGEELGSKHFTLYKKIDVIEELTKEIIMCEPNEEYVKSVLSNYNITKKPKKQ